MVVLPFASDSQMLAPKFNPDSKGTVKVESPRK